MHVGLRLYVEGIGGLKMTPMEKVNEKIWFHKTQVQPIFQSCSSSNQLFT
jgi:hypothetical protein